MIYPFYTIEQKTEYKILIIYLKKRVDKLSYFLYIRLVNYVFFSLLSRILRYDKYFKAETR
jgi:hypothetical protein